MYAYQVQPNQPVIIDGQTYRCLDAGRTYVNVSTGRKTLLGPLVKVEPFTGGIVPERIERCARCGEQVPVSGLERSVERYYDWDNPDEDAQGSILLSREVWTCRDTEDCRLRRRGLAHAAQMQAEAEDAAAREAGWGAIGGRA